MVLLSFSFELRKWYDGPNTKRVMLYLQIEYLFTCECDSTCTNKIISETNQNS